MQTSMFFAEEHHAKMPASDTLPGQVMPAKDWMAAVLASPFPTLASPQDTSRHGLFGRMSQISWRHGIPADFSGLPATLPNSGIMSPGECLISDTLGNPTSPDRACGWSDIVTHDAPPRYYLSQRALTGIARRDRKPRLFSPLEGEWLSMTERHAFWTSMAPE